MHSRVSTGLIIGIVGSLIAIPAAAADPAPPKKSGYDLNERICENITLTGSRLATKRFCGTRAQWEERRLLDRQAIEAVQRSPCVIQTNGANGRPSC